MDCLIRLVKKLSPNEVRFIQDYYTLKEGRGQLRLRLFTLISQGRIKNNQDAISCLYDGRKKSKSALSHLKKKLTTDILNILLVLDMDSAKEEPQKVIECEKGLLRSEILFSRGLDEMGREMLAKTLAMAREYELPQIQLSSYFILAENNRTSHPVTDGFDECIMKYKRLVQAKSEYFENNAYQVNQTGGNHTACSERTRCWEILSKVKFLCHACEFETAEQEANGLLEMITQNTSTIYSREMEARICRELFTIYMQMYNYPRSLIFARRAQELYHEGSEEYNAGLVQLMTAYIHNHQFEQARQLHHRYSTDLNNRIRWEVLNAAIPFLQADFNGSIRTLNQANLVTGESSQWCLAPRLLELLAILELKDYEWYHYRYESLRKKISNSKIQLSRRMQEILQLLKSAVQMRFDSQLLVLKERRRFALLSGDGPEYHWDPLGFELVNIPDWLLHKHSTDSSQILEGSRLST